MDQASIDLLHRALDVFVLGFQNFAEEIVGNADDPGETLVEAWLYFLHAAEHLICKHHRSPLASALGRTKERIQNLEEHVESYAKEAADARETSRNASERAHRAEIQLEEANQMRKNAEKRAEEIEEKRDEIADRLARASEETNEVARERDAMRESLRAKEEEQETVDSLRSKVEKLQRELTEAHARGMEAVRSSKDDAERRASQLQEEVLRLKSDLNERIKSLASVSKRRDELRTEVEEERDARRNAEADKEAWEALARRLQENAHDRETADREARARHTSIVGAARADTSTPSESVRKGGSSTNSDQAVSEEAHHAHSNHQGSDVVQKEQQRVPGDVMNQGDQVGKAIEEKKRLEERLRVCLQRAHDTLQRFAGISSGTESAPSDPESAISALTSLLHHQRLAPTEGGEEDSARELTSHRQARPFSPAKTSESKQQGKARASTSSLSASVTPTGRDIGIQVGGNQPTVGLSSRGGKSHLSERDSEMEEQLNSASLPRVVSRESQGEEAPANHQEMNQGNDTPLRRGRKSARAQRSSEKMEHQSPMQRSENTPVFGRGDEAESAVGKESEGKELTEEESIMKEPWLGRLGEAGEAQERGKDDHQGEIHGTGAFYQTSRGDRHAERLKEGNDSDEEAGSSEVSEESRDSLDPKLSTPYEAPSADNVTGYSQEWSAPRSVSALGCIETDEHFRAQMTEGQQSTTAAPIEQSELEGSADHSYAQPSKSSMVLHSRDDVLKSQQTDHAEKAATRDHNHGKGKWKLDTRSSSECWVPPMRSYDAATPHEQAARPKERPRSSSGVRGEARGVGHSIRVAARVSGDASTSRGFGPPTERRAPPTERRGTLKGGGNVHAIPVYLQLSESTRKKSGAPGSTHDRPHRQMLQPKGSLLATD